MAIKDNLKVYYKCDETSGNLIDVSGNNLTGTNNGTATFSSGKIKNGTNLNGSNQFFALTDADWDWFEYNQAFSISCWMKFGIQTYSTYIAQQFVGKQSLDVPFPGWHFGLESRVATKANLQVVLYNDYVTSGKCITAYSTDMIQFYNTWKHVVITYSGNGSYTGVKFYIDNSLQSTTPTNAGNETCTSTIKTDVSASIGSRKGDSASGAFNGSLDEIGIWNKELTTDEISYLWNGGAGLSLFPLSSGASAFF